MTKNILSTLLFIFVLTTFAVNAQSTYGDLYYRKWRVTIINPIGTNGVSAPDFTARYSINVIGGYHGGLDGLEIGSLYNYNKYYASGFQIAGLLNATGGSME